MNTDGKMSYRDFIFPVNPRVIRISRSKNIGVGITPYGTDSVKELGGGHRVVKGEGEFFGNGAVNDFLGLKRAFEKGGGGMLYIPSQKPFYALAKSLELTASDIEGAVGYSFCFIESFENAGEDFPLVFTGDGKTCLWNLADAFDIAAENLVSMNPHIKRPDIPVAVGERVRLC